MPPNSNRLFTNTGEPYKVTSIVNDKSLFDEEKYKEIGPHSIQPPIWLFTGHFCSLSISFCFEIALNYKQMWGALKSVYYGIRNFKRSTYEGFDDPHSIMMRKYKEVPEWAYLIILIISLVLAIICVKVYPAETPVWGSFCLGY